MSNSTKRQGLISRVAARFRQFLGGGSRLKYDAADSSKRRRQVVISSKSEDRELTPLQRQSILSQTRDIQRNFALAGFAIRKHLQYVSDFAFSSQTDDENFNRLLEEKMRWWSKRKNCDLAGRHNLQELITLIETHRVLDGDVGILKHFSGKIQLIEGDRIRTDSAFSMNHEYVHGVKLGKRNQDLAYRVHRRLPGGGFEFEREISADYMLLCGYHTRIDQIRGIAPMTPAILNYQHVYEGVEYAIAKAKLSQLLGLAVYTEDELEDDAGDELKAKIERKFGPGCMELMLRVGEKAEMVEAHTPSSEFQNFCEAVIRIAFSALDVPYSFYDGSKTNFYGSKGELEQYIDGCEKKQTDLIETLDEITHWLLTMWIEDGSLPLPKGCKHIDDVKFEWRGAGVPYWRLIEDSKGYLVAFQTGLANPQDTAARHQSDVYENIDRTAEVIAYARSKGVKLLFDVEPGEKTNVGL